MLRKILLAAVCLLGAGAAYVAFLLPSRRSAPGVKVARTGARLARGKYLYEHVTNCGDCHSEVDESRFGFPVVPGGAGKGRILPAGMGLPGTVVAANLTPDPETGIGSLTDGQIIRAVREGIGHDGRPLFPLMPYAEYSSLSDDDVQALVAYLRTLPAARNQLPATKVNFPMNVIMRFLPKPVDSVPPPPSDPVSRGKYLTRIGGCRFCHSPFENGRPVEGRDFSGSHEFQLAANARVVSANLTPDEETGIGRWSEQQFIDKFTQFKDYAAGTPPKVDYPYNSIMPWLGLSGASEDDLKAVFAYLKTVKPVRNAVATHPDAPEERNIPGYRKRAGLPPRSTQLTTMSQPQPGRS